MLEQFREIQNLIWGKRSWFLIGLILAGLVIFAIRHPGPQAPAHLDTSLDLKDLPEQLFYSWARMLIAYAAAILFALVVGTLAATREQRARILLPIIDVLQSIPVLGFFPTAIYWFGGAAQGRGWGIEAAAVFLIFTSQSWNLVFAVYDGIRAVPPEALEAVRSFGVGKIGRFRRLYLPAVFPRLTYNSVLSWANGWYFLMACEIIAIGPMSYRVRGLGSFLSLAIDAKDWRAFWIGIASLTAVIVTMSLFIWKPLNAYARQFKFESTKREGDHDTGARVLSVYRHAAVFKPFRYLFGFFGKMGQLAEDRLEPKGREGARESTAFHWSYTAFLIVFWFAVGVGLGGGCLKLFKAVLPPWEVSPATVLLALGASIIRIAVAYFICLAVMLPIIYAAHKTPKALRGLQSTSEVLAALPATAFFPLITAAAQRIFHFTEAAVLIVLLTGMIWYLFFNVISGAQALPNDIREASTVMGLQRGLYVRRVFFPIILPALITGSITAVGGGWNALILAEYFKQGAATFQVFGLGSILSNATYVSGNERVLSMAIFFMVLFIVIFNRYFWQPLYRWAENKYRLDA